MIDVKCYETLCRGVFNHENQEALQHFKMAPENPALNGPSQGFIKKVDDGKIETTIYFARVGNDEALVEEMYDRLYEKITGQAVSQIEI